jgi:hypothetical protein
MTQTPRIVNLNVTITRAPTPSQLQQSGALISIGGTTLATGSYQFCSQLSDLLSILQTSGTGNFTELGNMGTTFFAQGNAVGFYVLELGYNAAIDTQITSLHTWITQNPGIFYAYLVPTDWDYSKDEVGSGIMVLNGAGYLTVPAITFSYPSSGVTATGTAIIQAGAVVGISITNPGNGYTAPPTITIPAPSQQAVATCSEIAGAVSAVSIGTPGYGYTSAPTIAFAAGGGTTATGHGVINAAGVLTSIVVDNPGSGYVSAPAITIGAPPVGISATATANLASALNIIAGDYSAPAGMTYFFVTTTAANAPNYATLKSVFALAPALTAPSSEFSIAMAFYQWLVNNPGASNQLAPMSYRYAYGVTNWPTNGNSATINTILTAYANLIMTGAEGGISNACLFKGTTMDGEQAAWWYGIDWFQIQVKQALAAAIINGSNSNPPLLYNQTGINTLQAVAQQVANDAVNFGCALSAVVSAESFASYTKENPDDYNAGIYNGLSALVVGQNGFLTIQFNLTASQLVTS